MENKRLEAFLKEFEGRIENASKYQLEKRMATLGAVIFADQIKINDIKSNVSNSVNFINALEHLHEKIGGKSGSESKALTLAANTSQKTIPATRALFLTDTAMNESVRKYDAMENYCRYNDEKGTPDAKKISKLLRNEEALTQKLRPSDDENWAKVFVTRKDFKKEELWNLPALSAILNHLNGYAEWEQSAKKSPDFIANINKIATLLYIEQIKRWYTAQNIRTSEISVFYRTKLINLIGTLYANDKITAKNRVTERFNELGKSNDFATQSIENLRRGLDRSGKIIAVLNTMLSELVDATNKPNAQFKTHGQPIINKYSGKLNSYKFNI